MPYERPTEYYDEQVRPIEVITLSEYGSYHDAKNDLKILSGPFADWVTTPHFFWKGRFIVIFVGQDKKLISDLEQILGKQYTSE